MDIYFSGKSRVFLGVLLCCCYTNVSLLVFTVDLSLVLLNSVCSLR